MQKQFALQVNYKLKIYIMDIRNYYASNSMRNNFEIYSNLKKIAR